MVTGEGEGGFPQVQFGVQDGGAGGALGAKLVAI